MKTILRKMTLIALAGVLASGIYSCTKVSDTKDNEGIIEVAADGTTLFIKSSLVSSLSADLSYSEEELDILLHMKEEEKLAMDVYTALYAKWGSQVFYKISGAEENHMNAVILLLQSYGEEYTQIGDPGIFSIEEFQILYTQLVNTGSESIENAYTVGALIEEMDIKDLTVYLGTVKNENIIMVFENLLEASCNHLRAFNRQLVALGLTYTPVYITQDEYDEIISSPNESGNLDQLHRDGESKKRNGQG